MRKFVMLYLVWGERCYLADARDAAHVPVLIRLYSLV